MQRKSSVFAIESILETFLYKVYNFALLCSVVKLFPWVTERLWSEALSATWGFFILYFYFSTQALGPYLMDPLNLRLVGVVGAGNYVRSSSSQRALSMARV